MKKETPNSVTRRLKGIAGERLQAQQRRFAKEQAELATAAQKAVAMSTFVVERVKVFESLPLFRRWWLLVKEVFGRKHKILS